MIFVSASAISECVGKLNMFRQRELLSEYRHNDPESLTLFNGFLYC